MSVSVCPVRYCATLTKSDWLLLLVRQRRVASKAFNDFFFFVFVRVFFSPRFAKSLLLMHTTHRILKAVKSVYAGKPCFPLLSAALLYLDALDYA